MWCHVLLFGLPILGLPLFWWLPLPMALALYVPTSALGVWAGAATVQAFRQPPSTGAEAMVGRIARVDRVDGGLVVRMGSELWNAVTREPLVPGQSVVVTGVERLTVTVRSTRA